MPDTIPPYRVVVVDHTFDGLDIERAELGRSAFRVELVDAQCKPDDQREVIAATTRAHGIIIQNALINRTVIVSMKKCRVIALYGVGTENVDIEAATEHGIIVANVPDYCTEEVADHTMALILDCLRKVTRETLAIKTNPAGLTYGGPLFPPIFKLRGLVLGLVGFGNVARSLVGKAKPFGFRIVAHDPLVRDEVFRDCGVEPMGLEELLSASDVVSLHVPLSGKTIGLIGEAQLQRMKKTAFLINTARGPIVDEQALACALKESCIAGAGVDVTCEEPIRPGNPLLECDNLIITNHIGYYSEGCLDEVRRKAAGEVARVLSGKPPRPAAFVNPEARWEPADD